MTHCLGRFRVLYWREGMKTNVVGRHSSPVVLKIVPRIVAEPCVIFWSSSYSPLFLLLSFSGPPLVVILPGSRGARVWAPV